MQRRTCLPSVIIPNSENTLHYSDKSTRDYERRGSQDGRLPLETTEAPAEPHGIDERQVSTEVSDMDNGAAGRVEENVPGPGLRKVHQFIRKMKPKKDGPSSPTWQQLQLEETPTLLPDLR